MLRHPGRVGWVGRTPETPNFLPGCRSDPDADTITPSPKARSMPTLDGILLIDLAEKAVAR